jgi:hypothetical protein
MVITIIDGEMEKIYENVTRIFTSESRRNVMLCHSNFLNLYSSLSILFPYQYDLKFNVKGQAKNPRSREL